MMSPPPQVDLELLGFDADSTVAGAGKMEFVGGLRDSCRLMRFVEDDTKIEAIGSLVIRTWTAETPR